MRRGGISRDGEASTANVAAAATAANNRCCRWQGHVFRLTAVRKICLVQKKGKNETEMALLAQLCLLIMRPLSRSRPLRQIVCTISRKRERENTVMIALAMCCGRRFLSRRAKELFLTA